MDVPKVLQDLRAYKTQLDDAIVVFDRLARSRGKRGRPLREHDVRSVKKLRSTWRLRNANARPPHG